MRFEREAERRSDDVCLDGTHWHRPQCAHQCARTGSDDHPPAANANQVPNKKRA